MGASPSKSRSDNKSITPTSMRRPSKSSKISKADQLERKLEVVQNMQTEIDLFAGDRLSPRYSQIQETLTTISKDFQDAKSASTKEKSRTKYDHALNDVQKCLQRLESRVSFNEQHLDGAAIESHSFINQTFNSKPPPRNSPPTSSKRTMSPAPDYECAQNLDRLEHETHKLEQDVKLSIQLDDTKQLTFLEKKIQLLYTDLEMNVVDSKSPLSETKAVIGKRLIKCNNQIKKYRRISVHGKQNALARIERKLEYLEIQALTFEGTKNDRKYKEIRQNLENHLNDVNQIDDQDENTKEKIKIIMQELSHRAEENENQLEITENLRELDDKAKALQEKVSQYKGTSGDPLYIQLDQALRNVWANASEIDDANEHVRQNKEKIITNVQSILKSLSETVKFNEQTDLNKVKELQNLWGQINYELDVQNVSSDVSKPIIEILKKISDEIYRKLNALETVERRKSTGNLVVTKIIHVEDVAPMKTEIRVQPTLTVISEVQRIEQEIKSLCQQMRQSTNPRTSNQLKKYEEKLEQLNQALAKIESNRNGTIDSNKRRALKSLKEAYHIFEELKPERASKVVEVMDVHTEIQYYRQQIKSFKGVTKDHSYEKIKQGLSNCLTKLQIIDQEHTMKQDVIRQIQQYHQELETKLAENQAKVKVNQKTAEVKRKNSQETKNVIEQVQKLKSQVERFSGVYEGLQYKQIHEDLNNCHKKLEDIDSLGDERLESAKIQTKQKIRKYLKILEERSTKNEPVTENRRSQSFNTPHGKINAIRDQLIEIKAQTEEFGGRYKDKDYVDIESELNKCLDELKLVDDFGHKSVVISKEQYEEYIVKLLDYFEQKAKMNDAPASEETFKIMDPTKQLALIEENMEKLQTNMESSNADFSELTQLEASLRNELESVQVGNVAHVREMKKQLVEKLELCTLKLEEIASVLKIIHELKDKVTEVSREVRRFTGTKNDDKYNYLDETLIQLMLKLDAVNCAKNVMLNNSKADVRKMIEKFMKVLNERAKSVPVLI